MSQDSVNNGGSPTRSVTQHAAESSCWTRSDDQAFERALVIFPEDTPDRWERMAVHVPGKSPAEVRIHYETLVHDVNLIESGRVELPSYPKGTPWTEEEHKRFLIGLSKYGKGDWKSIARNAVETRTPTQVASHAQKYFLRCAASRKERQRTSIHDITIVGSDLVPEHIDQNWVPTPDVPMQQQFDQNWVPPPDVPMQQQFDQNWVPHPDVSMQQQFDQNCVPPPGLPMEEQFDQNWVPPLPMQQQFDQNWVPLLRLPMQQQFDQDWVPVPDFLVQQQFNQNWVPPPDVRMQQQSREMQQLNPPNNLPDQMG